MLPVTGKTAPATPWRRTRPSSRTSSSASWSGDRARARARTTKLPPKFNRTSRFRSKAMTAKPNKLLRSLVRNDYVSFVDKAFETACGEKVSKDPYVGVINQTAMDIYEHRTRRVVL